MPASEGRAGALEVLDLLREMSAVRSALGVWAADGFPLDPAWTAGLPVGTVGRLSGDAVVDKPLLDSWARQHTDGLIDRMPIDINDGILLVLAAAMSVRTRWVRPFTDWGFPFEGEAGPWQGRRYSRLARVTRIVDRVSVAPTSCGEITCLEILGTQGITVHLVIGEAGRSAREVLQGGLAARTMRGRKGSELRVGESAPALTVERVPDHEPDDRLVILTPRFSVNADHDLLKRPEVFGLAAVTKTDRGHFPALSPKPLAISQARQSAMAEFTAEGFEAAAVTAMAAVGAGMRPVPPRRVKEIRVELDRPFGFFASHRISGLILAAGWVAEPAPYQSVGASADLVALPGQDRRG
jgi:hypothetical protein